MPIMYDVVINGGAMTGSTLALALTHLTQGKCRIAIIEKQSPSLHQHSGFDSRCIALSDGTCQRLDQIQLPHGQSLWSQMQPIITPIQHIHVSDKGHFGLVEFHAKEFNLPQLGVVVELSAMGNLLLQQIQRCPNIDYICPDEIQQIERTKQIVHITLKNGRRLTTSLLVGADGANSKIAHTFNMTQDIIRQYGQTAIIANIQPQQAHLGRAFERFTDEGPIALLPMANNLMTLVWCVKQAEPLLHLSDAAFLSQLQQRFGWRLGKLQQCGPRVAYPLHLTKASHSIQPRVVLIGNAAQTLHPIAGQGFNLGIRDVLNLAKIVSDAFMQQQDWGEYKVLQRYAMKRTADQQSIINLTDGLVSLFSNHLLPMQIGRNLGLITLAQSQLLRQYFAKPTLGWI
ncbi:2-octaprenyl-6-methoxyphenyl hydroxylase [Conservatibacter flavescens]|uniref:2-octaprenyl-6-methoxyphenyl hydroxylase n=1 Tax=Conservatibacter flavescens TaxID=28161 RepID=A0A2M8S097_9PAST|nr:2-octaprenyl-6-methoxyphenyl hydroxylase [Conservatibacter flavescens]PJG84536.1 2-octaprenyl-6-methoxyphenyl hydroxylase [Conservatibacter flavescens]